jgi:hypothetical protein
MIQAVGEGFKRPSPTENGTTLADHRGSWIGILSAIFLHLHYPRKPVTGLLDNAGIG